MFAPAKRVAWRLRTALLTAILVLLTIAATGILPPHPEPASANPLPGVAAVDAGDLHTCALTTTGGVKCWGANYGGGLGDGTTADRSVPVDVVGLPSGVVSISVRRGYSCALTTVGGAKCWGSGYPGTTPVDVPGLTSGVTAIAAGTWHACVLTDTGGVKCWGDNIVGQLGDGTTTSRDAPQDVADLTSGVIAIAAGGEHTCVLTAAGDVKCWGHNHHGQLGAVTAETCDVGEGVLTPCSTMPVNVSGLSGDVTALALGYEHTCALTSWGGVKCWGANGHGQLGDSRACGTVSCLVPADVVGLETGVATITADGFHSCAVTAAGAAKCWGNNHGGELGNGTTTPSAIPVDVSGLAGGVATITAGGDHTCATTTSGGAKCWGGNLYGQLGNGTSGPWSGATTPVDVVEAVPKPTPTETPCSPEGCPTPTATPTATATLTPGPGLDFSLGIDIDGDTAEDCATTAGGETTCSVLVDSTFALNVHLNRLPQGIFSYEGFDIALEYAGISSKDNANVTWPDCAWQAEYYRTGFIAFGCGVLGSIPSTYIGHIGTSDFNCGADGTITMIHGFPSTTLYEDAATRHGEGDGTTETLTIHCVDPPTPTPTVPSVGGAGVFPDRDGSGASGGAVGALPATTIAALAAGIIGVATTAWYARRRRLL